MARAEDAETVALPRPSSDSTLRASSTHTMKSRPQRIWRSIVKFSKFVGPGFMVSVAYIDPGNYATDVAAGAAFRFKLLFILFMSNLFALFLQSLCAKLGVVTGKTLAEQCREHFPRWVNWPLYFFAEAAIIATDIAEVIGSAIALNLLFKIPIVAGCAITILDVLVILFFYRPSGPMTGVRLFEFFVMALVIGVTVCFCIQLSYIVAPIGEVFRGYLPSQAVVKPQGLYLSCGILGATVMPHSLYLGTGVVQSRLRHFDSADGTINAEDKTYQPSLKAVRHCLNYSILEVVLSLFTFALFVNSAILIVAGASLSDMLGVEEADLFGIYDLLQKSLAPAVGTLFAVALLLSGISAGIVCTMAGQIVSEGHLNWKLRPWLRRLVTRSMSIIPAMIVAGVIGKQGLSAALTATQVVLSIVLPFVTAPLIYFTCRAKFMTVIDPETSTPVSFRNAWYAAIIGFLIWLVIVVMDVALIVLTAKGTS